MNDQTLIEYLLADPLLLADEAKSHMPDRPEPSRLPRPVRLVTPHLRAVQTLALQEPDGRE